MHHIRGECGRSKKKNKNQNYLYRNYRIVVILVQAIFSICYSTHFCPITMLQVMSIWYAESSFFFTWMAWNHCWCLLFSVYIVSHFKWYILFGIRNGRSFIYHDAQIHALYSSFSHIFRCKHRKKNVQTYLFSLSLSQFSRRFFPFLVPFVAQHSE